MICLRHIPAVAALLGLTCIPTVLHSYMKSTASDERKLNRIPLQLNNSTGAQAHSGEWVPGAFETNDFIERHYGAALRLFVARSYNAKRLYHHPELAVAHGDDYERTRVERLAERPEVPVFVLKGREQTSVYALHYDTFFIANPIRFQLQHSVQLLVRPRQLMTLFFVRNAAPGPDAPLAETPEIRLLLSAVDEFLAQGARRQ
jgi:hypothetical protein